MNIDKIHPDYKRIGFIVSVFGKHNYETLSNDQIRMIWNATANGYSTMINYGRYMYRNQHVSELESFDELVSLALRTHRVGSDEVLQLLIDLVDCSLQLWRDPTLNADHLFQIMVSKGSMECPVKEWKHVDYASRMSYELHWHAIRFFIDSAERVQRELTRQTREPLSHGQEV